MMKTSESGDAAGKIDYKAGSGYSPSDVDRGASPAVTKELLSGLVVALASVPTSIAFASIAGVSPLIGIWSSVVLGAVSTGVGGRPGLIAGAAGVVVVPLAPLIASHGQVYMAPTVVLAALMIAAFGALKLGRLVDLVTDNVMKGFLNGLGCLLIKSQLAVLLGLTGAAQAATLAVALFTGLVVKLLPKVTTAIPSSLAAVVLATALSAALQLPVATLAQGNAATFAGGLAVLPTWAGVGALTAVPWTAATLRVIFPVAVSIAMISVLETLLASKVVAEQASNDGRASLGSNNRLLAGLAAGNVASAALGGFGGCGLIPQTLLNAQSGGRGALSAIGYAASMGGCVVLAAPAIGAIPVASLAGVMLAVAFATVQVEGTTAAIKAATPVGGRWNTAAVADLVALLAASMVCFFVDMAAGIVLGVALTKVLPRGASSLPEKESSPSA